MQDRSRLAVFVIVWLLLALGSSSSEAQQFYTAAGNNVLRVFGCAPLDSLTINGVGPTQQGECTSYQTGLIIGPALPIETWVTTLVSGAVNGVQAQNETLQREVDQLTARVQALEAALNRLKAQAAAK